MSLTPTSLAAVMSSSRRRHLVASSDSQPRELGDLFHNVEGASIDKATVLLTPCGGDDRTIIRELQVLSLVFGAASIYDARCRRPLWWSSFKAKASSFLLRDLLDVICEKLAAAQVQTELRILTMMCDVLYLACLDPDGHPFANQSDVQVLVAALVNPISRLDDSDESSEEVHAMKLRCKLLLSAILCRIVGGPSPDAALTISTIRDVVTAERARDCPSYFSVVACAAPLSTLQLEGHPSTAQGGELHQAIGYVLDAFRRSLAPCIPITYLLKVGDHSEIMHRVLCDLAVAVEGAVEAFRLDVLIETVEIETARGMSSMLLALEPFWTKIDHFQSLAELLHHKIAQQKWTSECKYSCISAYINMVTCLLRTTPVDQVAVMISRATQGLRHSVLNASRWSTSDVSCGGDTSDMASSSVTAGGSGVLLQALRLGESILASKVSPSPERVLLLRALAAMLVSLIRKYPQENIALLFSSENDEGKYSATASPQFLVDYCFRFAEWFAAVLPEDGISCDAVAELSALVATRLGSAELKTLKMEHLSEVMIYTCSLRRGPLRKDFAFGQSHAAMLTAVARGLAEYPGSAMKRPLQWLDALSSVDITAHGVEALVWAWVAAIGQFFSALDDATLMSVLHERMSSSTQMLLRKLFLVLLSVHRAFDDDFVLWSTSVSVGEALSSVLDVLSTFATCGFHQLIAQGIVQSDSLLADGDSCIGALLWLLFDSRIDAQTARVVATILVDVAENAPGASYTAVRTATNASTFFPLAGDAQSDKPATYRSHFGRRVFSSIADGHDAVTTVCRLVTLKALLVYETSLYFFLVTSGNASTLPEIDEDAGPLTEAAQAHAQFSKLLLDTAVDPATDARVRTECIDLMRRSVGVPATSDPPAKAPSSSALCSSTVEGILQSVVDSMAVEEGVADVESDLSGSPGNRSFMSSSRVSTRLSAGHIGQTPRSSRTDRRPAKPEGRKPSKLHWDEGMLVSAVCLVVAEEGHKLTPAIAPAAAEPGSPRTFLSSPRVGASPKPSFSSHRADVISIVTPMTPQTPKLWKGVPRVSGAEKVLKLSSLILNQLAEEIERHEERIIRILPQMQFSQRTHRVRLTLGGDYLLAGPSSDERLLNELISLVEAATNAVRGIEAVLLSVAASASDYFRVIEIALFVATLCHPMNVVINDILGSLLIACLQCVIAAADALQRPNRDGESDDPVGLIAFSLLDSAVGLMQAYTSRPVIVVAGMQAVRLCQSAGLIARDDWIQLSRKNVSLVVSLLQALAQQPSAVADDHLYTSTALLLEMSLRFLETVEHTNVLKQLTDGLWCRFKAILRHHRVEMFHHHNPFVTEAVSVLYVLDVVISQASCTAADLLKLDEILLVARRLGDVSHVHSTHMAAGPKDAPLPFSWHSLWCAVLLLLRTFLSQVIVVQPSQSEEMFAAMQGFVSTTPRIMLALRSLTPSQARDTRLFDLREVSLLSSLIVQCFSNPSSSSTIPTEHVIIFKELFLRMYNTTFRKDDEKAHLTLSILRDALEILCMHEIRQQNHVAADCVYAIDPQIHPAQVGGMGPPPPFRSTQHLGSQQQRARGQQQLQQADGPVVTFDLIYGFIKACITSGKRDSVASTPKEAPLDSSGSGSGVQSRASSAARSHSGDSDPSTSPSNALAPVIYPALFLTVKYANFYSQADGLSVADREAMKALIIGEIGKIVRALRSFDSDDFVQFARRALEATYNCFGLSIDWGQH